MMKQEQWIQSPENKTLKYFIKLKKKKYREEEKLFLAEGLKFLDYPNHAAYLLVREDKKEERRIASFSCPVFFLNSQLFQKISTQENSQGILVIYQDLPKKFQESPKPILILDGIQDPGNLGTIFRLMDAAGYEQVFLTEDCVDAYNEKVVRSSMGSIFHIQFHRQKKADILSFLKQEEYHCLVTSLQEDSISYTDLELKEKTALILGNEGHGVSEEFLELASQKIIIPISGKAESLNVAMATAVLLFSIRDLKKRSE